MKRTILVCFLLFPFLFSCASTPSEPMKSGYEKDAIELHAKANKLLNYKNKKSHALVVCVYQLSNPNPFNQLRGSREGLYSLLECSVFDPASVSVTKQVVVNPGKDVNVKLDRAEGARYVALVAGYYDSIEKDKITRLYQIPEVTERSGLFWLKKTVKPGKLDINVILGSKQIYDPKPAEQAKAEKTGTESPGQAKDVKAQSSEKVKTTTAQESRAQEAPETLGVSRGI